jgi:hypothetical protein
LTTKAVTNLHFEEAQSSSWKMLKGKTIYGRIFLFNLLLVAKAAKSQSSECNINHYDTPGVQDLFLKLLRFALSRKRLPKL